MGKSKEKAVKSSCFICKSIRNRQDLIELDDGRIVHSYHSGINSMKKKSKEVRRDYDSIEA